MNEMDRICEAMRDVRSKVQNLSALCLLLRTVILLKISGVANVSKSEFTLRSWQRSSLDITLRVISDKSSKGRFVVWCASGMTLEAKSLRESNRPRDTGRVVCRWL
jgi:hypothetical protein